MTSFGHLSSSRCISFTTHAALACPDLSRCVVEVESDYTASRNALYVTQSKMHLHIVRRARCNALQILVHGQHGQGAERLSCGPHMYSEAEDDQSSRAPHDV